MSEWIDGLCDWNYARITNILQYLEKYIMHIHAVHISRIYF